MTRESHHAFPAGDLAGYPHLFAESRTGDDAALLDFDPPRAATALAAEPRSGQKHGIVLAVDGRFANPVELVVR